MERIRVRGAVCAALVCSGMFVIAAGAQAAAVAPSTSAGSECTTVVTGAPWRARAATGMLTGNRYTIKARGTSCATLGSWVAKTTHEAASARITGPKGFVCRSLSTAAAGDKLLYAGACMHPPHNVPFFLWGPKVPTS